MIKKTQRLVMLGIISGGLFVIVYSCLFNLVGQRYDRAAPVFPAYAGSPAAAGEWLDMNNGIPAQVGITAIVIAPSDPQVMYLATSQIGGLYRSGDGGFHWEHAANGLMDVGVLSLAVHPEEPRRVYAGTVSGLYRTDDGTNWRHLIELDASFIYAILPVAESEQDVLAGAEAGLFRSEDAGESWYPVDNVDFPVLSLSMGSDAIYAGTAARGVWASSDNGLSWVPIDAPFSAATVPHVQESNGIIYARMDNELFYSHQTGYWRKARLPSGWGLFSFAVSDFTSATSTKLTQIRIYAGSRGKGVAAGQHSFPEDPVWQQSLGQLNQADITCLAVHPENSGIAFLGTKFHGLYRTEDAGLCWKLVSENVGRRIVMALARDPQNDNIFYAGTVDGVYGSWDGGRNWNNLTDELGQFMVQGLAVDPSDSGRIYAATHAGILQSENAGRTWSRTIESLGTINVFNIAISPSSDGKSVIYAGSWGNNVLRSRDDGQTWAPIHNGLETLSVHAFAVEPGNPDVLYVGTVERIYRSDNGGDIWYPADGGIRSSLTTFALACDWNQPTRVYAGTTAGVYRSENGGENWSFLGNGLGEVTINALTIDPVDSNVVYAGTEHHGLYFSLDRGEHWFPSGLKKLSVYTIFADDTGQLWIGTEGGVFRESTKSRHEP